MPPAERDREVFVHVCVFVVCVCVVSSFVTLEYDAFFPVLSPFLPYIVPFTLLTRLCVCVCVCACVCM